MKGKLFVIYIIFFAFTISNLCAEPSAISEVSLHELNLHLSKDDPHEQIRFEWLLERYDFQQIELYIENYYGTYYRYYERYLTIRQQEFAYKLGLSDIFLQPNFREYENTKLVFTKNVFDDKLTIRYLAPLRDMGDFEISVAYRPSHIINFIVKTEINGESSIAAAVNRPFGGPAAESGQMMKRTKRFLGKVTGLKIH